jgi:HlyD family secretion protein
MISRSLADSMIRRDLTIAMGLTAAVVAGGGGWAATVPLSGAVIASGTVVVDSYVKRVQHLTGGVVADILVHNGSKVAAGDVLIRLDPTLTEANLAIVSRHLDELLARETRLAAERDGESIINFRETFQQRLKDPNIAKTVEGEMTLFRARRASRDGKRSQLNERATQFLEEVRGLEVQIVGKDKEIEILNDELAGVQLLRAKGLMEQTRVNSLESDAARLVSERGVIVSSIAQTRGRIAETKLQILEVDEDLQQEVAKELRETSATMGELLERKIAAESELKRVEIRAPQSGFVHELSVHTKDAIITAGETVMLIVPDTDNLEVEARIPPQDIDQIVIGQTVDLRFSAFNQRTTPEIPGSVDRVGADLTTDEHTGLSYYTARIDVRPEILAHLGEMKLLPGMPVEVFLETEERTTLSYLAKPLLDQIARAFREQ